MEPIFRINQIHFAYDDGHEALKGIDLNIHKGRKIACMGANGSGKSTFFLCLNGILRPQKGTILFHGKTLSYSRKNLLALRSKVGIVFQDPDNQLFSASVYQEISFGILNLGVSTEQAREEVDKVIDLLEITPFKNKPTHILSGGQKKQVSIADILVMNPEIIILDEPAASLDPKHTNIVNRLIDELTARGITVIISTHDADYAYRWADEIILFHEGQILTHGSPKDVFVQKELLKQTNLVQPAVISLFEVLCEKGVLSQSLPLPDCIGTLKDYIKKIN